MKTKTAVLNGKPDAGNPHVRFDEGEVASAKPRRGSLLYKLLAIFAFCAAAITVTAAEYRLAPKGASDMTAEILGVNNTFEDFSSGRVTHRT